MNKYQSFVNFLHEIEMLSYTPRSGFAFLGSGKQSVAEHSYGAAGVAFVLARTIDQPVDLLKLIMMCLFHDLPEARIGDIHHFQKIYVTPKLDKALEDIEKTSTLGPEVVAWIKEYEEAASLEAQLAHDADQLELLLILKKEEEMGNFRTKKWVEKIFSRLHTEVAKNLAETICQMPSDHWWSA